MEEAVEASEYKGSDLINRMSESATLAMARMARELKEQGKPVISLSLGEPDFNTPEFVKQAAKQAIDDNYSHYPPVNGYLDVREAVAKKFKRDNNLDYSADQIVLSTGAKQSIANVVMSLVNPGEEVILPAPYWVSYDEIVKMAGGIPVILPTTIHNDFKITPEALEEAINPNTRLIIYSSPCNPSGSVYSSEELTAIARVIERHKHVYVISDEIYELINFEGENTSLATNEFIYDRVITVNGVSKAFAMTGYRLGYIGAPEWIAKACSKIQGQITSAPSGISQMAAKAAVEADTSTVSFMKETFLKRRDMMIEKLREIPRLTINIPGGAFYLFPNISSYFGSSFEDYKINNANGLCMYILETELVALVAGEAFGNPNCLRISYAASDDDLKEACIRIARALSKLKK